MSNKTVNDILQRRLNDTWGGQTPIVYDNMDFTPTRGEAFIRCVLDAVESRQISMKCTRTEYVFTVQVFTPSNEGVDYNLILSDDVINTFMGYSEDDLIVLNSYTERTGEEEEWHQRNVRITLTYDNHV